MKAASLHLPIEATAAVPRAKPFPTSPGRAAWPVALLGVVLDNVSTTEAVARIAAWIDAQAVRRVEMVTTARLVGARHDPSLAQSLADADLALCDSGSLRWASHCVGNALRERIRSADLARGLALTAAQRGWRVFFLTDAAEGTATLRNAFPPGAGALNVCGSYAPLPGNTFDERGASSELARARPDLIVARAESPAFEHWLATSAPALAGGVLIHLAGPLPAPLPDSPATHVIRPPPSWRERLRRAAAVGRQIWRERRGYSHARPPTSGAKCTRCLAGWLDVDAGACLTRAALERAPAVWRPDAAGSSHCALDASRVRHIDATGLALLGRYRRACRRAGRQFVLVTPSEVVRAALARAGMLPLFPVAATVEDAHRLAPARPNDAAVGVKRSLAWCGEIIAANVEDVWQMTSDYVHSFVAQGATLVIIDLTRLRFIDSAGGALMLRAKRCARELRTEILFAHPQPPVTSVLRLMAADNFVLEGAQ